MDYGVMLEKEDRGAALRNNERVHHNGRSERYLKEQHRKKDVLFSRINANRSHEPPR